MRPLVVGRLSIRAAVVLGFGLTLGLWLFTGYQFRGELAESERTAAAVTARYNRAQDLLSTVRAQILLISVHVRDALLDPNRASVDTYRQRLDLAYKTIDEALGAYSPVVDATRQPDDVQRLRAEVEAFRRAMTEMLDLRASGRPVDVRDLLNRRMVPRRESAIGFSEQVQALNRAAFIQQQMAFDGIRRDAERRSLLLLGLGLLASFAIALLATFYAGRLEDRLRAQRAREARTNEELQRLSSRLIAVQEDERRTIARELHDEVGQLLTAVKVGLTVARRSVMAGPAPPAAPGELDEALSLADGALQSVRNLSHLLHPQVLDDLGLAAAIDWHVRELRRRHGLRIELEQDGVDTRVAPGTELAAYRLVQEALTNTIRHARASSCRVRLARSGPDVVIEVADDGCGFDAVQAEREPRTPDGGTRGLGLIGMRERVTHCGGTLRIDSRPGHGTRIVAILPAGQAPSRVPEAPLGTVVPPLTEPANG